MGRLTIGRALAFGVSLFLLVVPRAQTQQEYEWTWKDKSGVTRTSAELDEILRKHHEWVESKGKSGRRADLSATDLNHVNYVSFQYGPGLDLRSANLFAADLSKAILFRADLSGADLSGAVLTDADLSGAIFTDAELFRANLSNARLAGANLTRARLLRAILVGADLSGAELSGAALGAEHLGESPALSFIPPEEAKLAYILSKKGPMNLNLEGSLGGVVFEPKSLPEVREIAAEHNLELLTYKNNPDALVQLRKQFQDAGLREQERKITYALKRREAAIARDGCKSRKTGDKTRAILWSPDSNLANCASLLLNRVFFDLTCQYGMSPGRPLSLGILLWLLCSVLYVVSIRSRGQAGLYRVYSESIQDGPLGQRRVERITPPSLTQTRGVRRLLEFLSRECRVMRASMFFSLMSAFNIGFRDINFGRWLRLLTRQEFDIKAVGWARVVAGWQSLISVYFIALWVLTYFGRPFE